MLSFGAEYRSSGLFGSSGFKARYSPDTLAVSWAQAERDLPCFGTTHADHFYGPVPVTRRMRDDEIRDAYEHNTGVVIAECLETRALDPVEMPAVLVAGHGPFTWGSDAAGTSVLSSGAAPRRSRRAVVPFVHKTIDSSALA